MAKGWASERTQGLGWGEGEGRRGHLSGLLVLLVCWFVWHKGKTKRIRWSLFSICDVTIMRQHRDTDGHDVIDRMDVAGIASEQKSLELEVEGRTQMDFSPSPPKVSSQQTDSPFLGEHVREKGSTY